MGTKKVGFESWEEVDVSYVDSEVDIPCIDSEDMPQISHIESLQIDFEGEHMILTFNFNQPTLVEYRTATENGIQSVDVWETSLTVSHGPSIWMCWESSSTYNYDGESFVVYRYEEDICSCNDYYFYCLYSIKNILTDAKGKINRLIMYNYPSDNNNYAYEFEREKLE